MASGQTPRKVKKLADSTHNLDETNDNRDYDAGTQKALEEIDNFQNEIEELCEQTNEEILEIERKYNKLRKPFMDKRNASISKIPHFWVTAFINHPDLSAILDDAEEDCLHHLTKLEVEEFEDIKSGYRIHFYFEENPYFENSVLTKEFHLGSLDEPESQSTPIKWKEGFNLTQSNEPRSTKRNRKRHLEQKSFFAWFNDHVDPASDDIAEIIKDDLWLNPLNYYLVPDIEVENGAEEEDGSDGEEEAETEAAILQNLNENAADQSKQRST